MKDVILVVDDIEINRIILRDILSVDYEVVEASSGLQAIDFLFNTTKLVQAVLLDIMMPEMDGFEVLDMIKTNPNTENIPVLFITAADIGSNETRCLTEGAVDYISKPFNPAVVKARVDNHIQLKRYRTKLETMVDQKTAQLMQTHEHMLETLATIIEYRSLESGTHIKRSSELARILVNHLRTLPQFRHVLSTSACNDIAKAMSLHDIGKVGIPDSILLKPGRLTPEEFEIIKQHSIIGSNIIDTINTPTPESIQYLKYCREICRWHHERYDGKGYPDGLAGEDIPLSARVASIVDVYDALMTRRCYKPAYTHEQAMTMVVEGAGTQFDPNIVRALENISSAFEKLELDMSDPAV